MIDHHSPLLFIIDQPLNRYEPWVEPSSNIFKHWFIHHESPVNHCCWRLCQIFNHEPHETTIKSPPIHIISQLQIIISTESSSQPSLTTGLTIINHRLTISYQPNQKRAGVADHHAIAGREAVARSAS